MSRLADLRGGADSREEVLSDYRVYHLTGQEWIRYLLEGTAVCAVTAYVFYRSFLAFVLMLPAGMLRPFFKRRELCRRRKEELRLQFKEAIQIVASALAAGYSVENAFIASVRDLEEQYGKEGMITREFSYLASQLKMNQTVEALLSSFAKRSGLDEVENFSVIFTVSKRSRGELASVVHHVVHVISDRIQVREEILTMTAEKQFEQRIMNLMPYLIVLYVDLSSPGFFSQMYETAVGRVVMTGCLVVYLLAWRVSGKILQIEVRNSMGKMGKKQVLCILLGIILAVAGYLVEKRDGALEDGNRLNRYAYGEGERQQEVWVRGLCEKEIPVEISLGEREYAEEDAKKALLEAGGKLADLIRGNNLSLQEVREDLHLVGWLEEEGIRVRWTPEDAEWIQTDGTVLNEECPEKGIQTELTASLQAGVFSREYRFPVTLYPPLRTKQQEKEAGFKRLLKQMDEAQRTEGQLVLPKMYEGKNLSYRVRGDREYLLFPVLGIAAAILLPLYEKQKESEAKKKKKRELMEDYPEIVSKLTVFSGAGLPVRRAWERIVLEYEAACRSGTQTERAAYREMAAAYHRMQRGVPELQAYAEFGAGCRLRPYRKLSGLLEQNVRNGAEGLRKALETEMESAFEEEKALARRRGEEASTKLMLPLFLMLMIIMVMVSVPAFLAFGI